MALAIVAEPASLETNADGIVQVEKTRVTLDTVITVFKQGATAEEIVHRYPSLKLGDVICHNCLLPRQDLIRKACVTDCLLVKLNEKYVETAC